MNARIDDGRQKNGVEEGLPITIKGWGRKDGNINNLIQTRVTWEFESEDLVLIFVRPENHWIFSLTDEWQVQDMRTCPSMRTPFASVQPLKLSLQPKCRFIGVS